MTSAGLRRAFRAAVVVSPALWLALAFSALGEAQRSKGSQQSYAVVAGTVFQEDGRVLRGAQVSLRPSPEDGAPAKAKPLTSMSDTRGEFAFRVPPSPMRYTVSVKAPGFQAQDKQVIISGEERQDVYFQMERTPPET
ncbi:MAG TPA: carboxypeptidase-like regulatory domain-containing protein [Bryobacteraceae bacterium]|nr:carboxypeptidase-like regulatory domain-containing protein [Bryobacteraceae bacterium]